MLISEIYEYNNTYHHKFNTNNFKKELEKNYMKIQLNRLKSRVINNLLSDIEDGCSWFNEYGYIGYDYSII